MAQIKINVTKHVHLNKQTTDLGWGAESELMLHATCNKFSNLSLSIDGGSPSAEIWSPEGNSRAAGGTKGGVLDPFSDPSDVLTPLNDIFALGLNTLKFANFKKKIQ